MAKISTYAYAVTYELFIAYESFRSIYAIRRYIPSVHFFTDILLGV